MLNYILWFVSHLKFAWNLLLNYSLFPNYNQEQQLQHRPGVAEKLGLVTYKCKQQQGCFDDNDEEEEEACAVCLCKIEEDDEMRELRCNHLFHKVEIRNKSRIIQDLSAVQCSAVKKNSKEMLEEERNKAGQCVCNAVFE
ncbi:PREDICTED: uncharacterized protein LOC18610108 isoform X2 [Theobroma cacao]|uniref:Uncharacterized protein LOC18610108 isoform X2 n=1 Tax=Theobroma cacao TaxID=3641 RepID=A0AB32VW18_THECC|nr:PREDICTED: uncharacterized protein LOC18610108 isoform X2 [Theobroma cacao]